MPEVMAQIPGILNKMGCRGDAALSEVWHNHTGELLYALPIIEDPEFCLDGARGFYAKQATRAAASPTV